ncbi:MAG TPA: gluconokinase [Pyrinomonadaceae bacterium]|nr:gluconokinase [Pyrinomonadaceae bacterium]
MSQKHILGIDIGTSSVRAALYDERAKMLPNTLVKNERQLTATNDGGSEIDAGEALLQVSAVIGDVLAHYSEELAEESYVATASFWHSLIGVDVNGNPTTKVFGWADTRSRNYTKDLKRRFNETEIHNRTGAKFHSSFWPAKLLWLRKEFPDVFARTSQWLSLSDYLALKLFGTSVTSVSMASGTGLLDLRTCKWDSELLKFLKIQPKNLPRLADDGETFVLNTKFARRWPRLKDARWFPAIADGAANNIGAGCVTKDRAALMVGTSGAMRVAYEGKPPAKIPDGLWCYRIDRKRVIVGGALSDGGGLYQWLRQTLRLDARAEAELAKRAPGAHGLVFLPFLAGERSTGYNEDATGSIVGLRSSTDATDILQAALESVAFRFAEIFDRLNSVCPIREIIASGGALNESRVWTQIIADVLGRELNLPVADEASMRGAVLLALGLPNVIETTATTVTPSSVRNKAYRKARKRHQEVYRELQK